MPFAFLKLEILKVNCCSIVNNLSFELKNLGIHGGKVNLTFSYSFPMTRDDLSVMKVICILYIRKL